MLSGAKTSFANLLEQIYAGISKKANAALQKTYSKVRSSLTWVLIGYVEVRSEKFGVQKCEKKYRMGENLVLSKFEFYTTIFFCRR